MFLHFSQVTDVKPGTLNSTSHSQYKHCPFQYSLKPLECFKCFVIQYTNLVYPFTGLSNFTLQSITNEFPKRFKVSLFINYLQKDLRLSLRAK